MRSRWLSLFAVFSLGGSLLFAQTPRLRTRPDGPPALPFPAPFASRGMMLGGEHWQRVAQDTNDPNQQTVMLPLTPGITLISIPLRTQSQVLSDLLQNLPNGSRVWTWDALEQQFVEGFDQKLPEGQGAILYVPSPTVITVTGDTELSDTFPVELQNGWNLVGVPYGVPLPRSSQTVYSLGVSAGFNDSVTNGDLGPDVFSLDSRGQQPVGDEDSFQPMNAYWVYSNDAELLELQPSLLKFEFTKEWALEKLGGLIIQFGGSKLMAYLSPDPNQPILDALAAISTQIQNIQTTQSAMFGRLSDLEDKMGLNTEEILQLIGEQPVDEVRTNLKTDYDGTSPYKSFMWFQNAAKKAVAKPPDFSDLKLINNQVKADFDQRVLGLSAGGVDYEKQFDKIYGAITRPKGVLDNYAQQIVLARNSLTLKQRYEAMLEYFNTLLGYQAKCMALVTNAYTDLAQNPAAPRPYPAGAAENWRLTTYVPEIKQEISRFRTAVETILVGSLSIRTKGDQPAVSIPAVVQDEIMPSADFVAMTLLQEPPGLRLRVLVSPDMNPNDIYRLGSYNFGYSNGCCTPKDLPSTDSGLWKRVSGITPYDSWQIDAPTSVAKFFVTKDWLMWKPTDYPMGVGKSGDFTFFLDDSLYRAVPRNTSLFVRKRIGFVDADGNPATSGTFFGSVVMAARASASTMLSVDNARTSGFCLNKKARLYKGPNVFIIGQCDGAMTLTQQVPFTYGGNGSVTGDWIMDMSYDRRGKKPLFQGYGYIRVSQGSQILSDLNRNKAGDYQQVTPNIQWQSGQTYQFDMTLYHREDYHVCPTYGPCPPPDSESAVSRGPLVMRFR